MRSSIRSEGMTLFLEPKALYQDPKAATTVPDDFEVIYVLTQGSELVIQAVNDDPEFMVDATVGDMPQLELARGRGLAGDTVFDDLL